MNANHQEKILQLEEKQKSMSSEVEKLKSMIKDKQGSKDDHEAPESEDFIIMQKKLEESLALFAKQCSAHGTLTQTFQKLRHDLEGKEKSDRKNVELEKKLCISSDEKYALKIKNDEMEKCMEEMQEELKELESFNQRIMVREHKSNHENQEARKELIKERRRVIEKNAELEKMLSISSDEKYALQIKNDEMKKCMEEMQEESKELESFNQTTMAMERKSNHENQEVRKELIKSMQEMQGCVNIGIKRLGELDLAPFAAVAKKRKCFGSAPPEAGLESDSSVEAQLLCSLWEKHLADPGWHPFKMVAVGDKDQEIIDDEDLKLKGLKNDLGEDAYKAVTTSLVELNEHNPSGRCPISEIWNFKEGRKASLKEGYSVVLEKLKTVGKNSVVFSPSIAATNSNSSAPGSNIVAAKHSSPTGWEILDAVVSSPSIAATNSSSSAPGSNIVAAKHSSPTGCEIPDAMVSSPIIAATDPSSSAPSCLDGCEIPKAVFHDFMAHKSYGNFQSGQIWALYCYSAEFPRYYVQITQVKMNPDFELHVLHLGSSYPPKRRIRWADKNMPICCGTFTVADETEVYKDTKAFSHMLHADLVSKSSYEIYPRKGEVWAVYKNFNPKWTLSDLKTCMYDIVEVRVVYNREIRVDMLEQVSGYKTVFKRKIDSEVIDITHAKSLTISHQIPAFRLTGQKEGSLRGYWELDPNSIPVHYFSSN